MSASNRNADDIPLAIEPRMTWLVNNQRFADVTFVVGEGKQIVYAHKTIIASGSPVFERMFFANHELRMSGSEPIEISDLTAAGFINMLSYIYTNQLNDFDLSQLFETFVAGDKYQVYNMNATMCSIIKDKLNASNCCIIYDQLMHLPSEQVGVSLDQVKAMIRYNSGSAFNGEHFVNISEETLVDLLKMDALTIDEIDVLRSCAKWVDEEVKRQNLEANRANKLEIFKAIKNFIDFSEITLDQLKNFNPVKDLLTSADLSSLLLHHLDVSTIKIECNAARKKPELKSACCTKHEPNIARTNIFKYKRLDLYLSSGSGSVAPAFFRVHIDLELSIYGSGLKLGLNYEKLSTGDNSWKFQFIDHVKIDAVKRYKFVFKFPSTALSHDLLSLDTIMNNAGFSALKLTLSTYGGDYHCLKKIDFYDLFS